jgi:Txe/YoeB family toxin of Txe-Axe toxin-antitoxin module
MRTKFKQINKLKFWLKDEIENDWKFTKDTRKKINKRIRTIFEKIKNEKFRLKDAIEEKNSQKG